MSPIRRSLTEIGSFDTYLSPSANSAGTDGAWGVYPFLPSGTLLVSDIENGMFLLQEERDLAAAPPAVAGSAAASFAWWRRWWRARWISCS